MIEFVARLIVGIQVLLLMSHIKESTRDGGGERGRDRRNVGNILLFFTFLLIKQHF